MAQSTGPILAIGAITVTNQSLFHNEPINIPVLIGTGLASMIFSLAEKAQPNIVPKLAYLALVTTLFVRLKKNVPSPVETALKFFYPKGV